MSKVFAPWHDPSLYKVAPGGSFEGSSSPWQFFDDAVLATGTSPLGGEQVVSLPVGASVLSPPICIDGSEAYSRMFTRSIGTKSRLRMGVITRLGADRSAGMVYTRVGWRPSSRFAVPRDLLPDEGPSTFRYRFKNVGASEAQIDSVYVDPRARH